MKQMLIVIILLGYLRVDGQLQGIGPFKINKTDVSVIDSIVKQSYSKRFDTTSYQDIVFQASIDTITKRINPYLISYEHLHIFLLKKRFY